MLKELVKLANHLDRIGKTKEADYIDNLIKNAQESHSDTDRVYIECLDGQPNQGIECEQDRSLKGFVIQLNDLMPSDSSYSFEKCVKYSDKVKLPMMGTTNINNIMDDILISKYTFAGLVDPDKEIVAKVFGVGAIDDGECHDVEIKDCGMCKIYFSNNLREMYIIKD